MYPEDYRASLQRLSYLRLIAIAGQCAAIAVTEHILGLHLPLLVLAVLLGVLLALNAVAHWRLRRPSAVTAYEIGAQLFGDLLQLTAMLALTGGSTNPFSVLYLLPLMIAAATLPPVYSALLAGAALLGYTLLLYWYIPLPHQDPQHLFTLHMLGMWLAFVLCVLVVVWFVAEIAESLRQRDRRLAAAREQALRDEKILALATLSAGAAHELGTPLSTIAVLARELERQVQSAEQPELAEDLRTLRQQVDACKQIISSLLASTGQARAEAAHRLPLDHYLEQVLQRWRTLRPQAALHWHGIDASGALPTILAEETLTQALLNLLNNGADASSRPLDVYASCTTQQLRIRIDDHGAGIAPELLPKLGNQALSGGRGAGLGALLAKAAIERLGGQIRWSNRAQAGATAEVELPLAVLRI